MTDERPERWYRDYPVTGAILALYLALFLGMCLAQRCRSGDWPRGWRVDVAPSVLVLFGAIESDAVLVGNEYWRLLAATVLHANWLHLLVNGFALWQLGRAIEIWFSGRLLVILHVVLGIAANVTSVWYHRNAAQFVQVGASGATFGFVGFIALVGWYGRHREGYYLLRIMTLWTAFNLAFGAWIGADNAAHIGGAVAGVLVGLLAPLLEPRPGIRWPLTIGCGAAIGVVAAATVCQVHVGRRVWANSVRQTAWRHDADQLRLVLIADRQLRGVFVLAATKPDLLNPPETRRRLADALERLGERIDNVALRHFVDEGCRLLAQDPESAELSDATRNGLNDLGRRYGTFLQNAAQ